MSNIALTKKSSNGKVGTIPVTVSGKDTCPASCPLLDNGCYASSGFHTRLHWDKVSSGERGTGYSDFLESIVKLPAQQLWRHNVSGDLQGSNNIINKKALRDLTSANWGKRGFTYTHYPMSKKENRQAVQAANVGGFTVNASCDSPKQAVAMFNKYDFPIVTITPSDFWTSGNKVGDIVRCPAEYNEEVTCKTCKLCAVSDRKVIVGFTVHGTGKAKADIIASA